MNRGPDAAALTGDAGCVIVLPRRDTARRRGAAGEGQRHRRPVSMSPADEAEREGGP